jgi:radical SAM protein with 4Fe4S-binding SPASM domain
VNEIVSILDKPLDITGGDPFVYENLESYLNCCFEMNLNVSSIFTNGVLLLQKREFLKRIYARNKDVLFFVSLDGYQGSHDAFRGKGSFEKAIEGATLLKNIGFQVHINTILHNRANAQDVENLYCEIKNRGFDRWRVDTPFNAGNWVEAKDKFNLDFEEAFERFNLILRLWFRDAMPFELELDHVLKFIGGQFYYIDQYSVDSPVCPCRTLPIWPDGNITWCQDLYGEQFVIGNIYDDVNTLYDKYKPYKQRTIGEMIQSVPQCRECGYLNYCGVGCRANSILLNGKYFDKDSELCFLFNSGLYKTIAQTIIDSQNVNCANKEQIQ